MIALLTTQQWQRMKLKSNLTRELRWFAVDMDAFLKQVAPPLIEAFDTFASGISEIIEKYGLVEE